jgi:hypothetical protein
VLLCARHRVSDTRQSFRVHSVDHLLAIMFSYAQARLPSDTRTRPVAL